MAKKETKENIITLDAKDKILGRFAVEVATYLQGKHLPSFNKAIDFPQFVEVNNIKEIKVTGKKPEQKIYWHHSGYPGGIYGRKYKDVFEKDPPRVLRYAVKGMLPKNKLQARRMKRLIIKV